MIDMLWSDCRITLPFDKVEIKLKESYTLLPFCNTVALSLDQFSKDSFV